MLAGTYVSLHYDLEFGTPERAVRGFLQRVEMDMAQSAFDGVEALLAELPHEQARQSVLRGMRFGYAPKPGLLDDFLSWTRETLRDHVHAGGHRSDANAAAVLWDTSLIGAGSYPELTAAEACVNVIFRAHVPEISAFCEGPRKRMRPLRAVFDYDVGTLVNREQVMVHPRSATLLVHNEEGYPLIFNSCPEEPRPPAPDFPTLEVLFGAYFHPDWIDDHESPLDILPAFVSENPTEDRQLAVAELKQLAAMATEDDRRTALLALGSYFVPRPPGQVDTFLAMAISYLETEN